MSQLGLNIRPLLSYKAEAFVQHAGVGQPYNQCKKLFSDNLFSIVFVTGPARSGKTHFGVRLMEDISAAGKFASFVEGSKLEEWLGQEHQFNASHVTIIDDAQIYLATLSAGHSGPMVNVIERARHSGAKILILSSARLETFGFDDHVGSRLRAAFHFELGPPAESELGLVLAAIARQRGLHLTGRKLTLPSRRIARDIGAIEEYVERVLHLSKVIGKKVGLGVLADAV